MSRKRRGEFTNIPYETPQKGAFGEQQIAHLTPIVQAIGSYGIQDEQMETFTSPTAGGTVSATNSEFVCNTGTNVGGYGVIRSNRAVIYHPGQGVDLRFTARFDTPVALSFQAVGGFTSTDGLFFGYDGTSFGAMHRYGGQLEHRHINLTASASGSETLTLTLNSVAYSVDLTSGTAAHNAYEIADQLNQDATASANWSFTQNDERVEILAKVDGPLSGTYSFSSTGTADANITQKNAGVTKTQDWTYQEDWNVNTCDWLDPSKGNVYRVQFQYLGYGSIKFYVEDPVDGYWKLVHEIKWANNNTSTSFTNPALKLGWIAASLGSTTDLAVRGASVGGFIEGNKLPLHLPHSVSNTNSAVGTTAENILTVRNRRSFKSTTSQGEINALLLSVSSDGTKDTVVNLLLNPDVTGETNYQYVNEDDSIAEYETSANTVDLTTGHKFLTIIIPAGGGSETVDLKDYGIDTFPLQEMVVAANVVSGASAEVTASLTWVEDI